MKNSERQGTFISPMVDSAFKIVFGNEENKELLIDLLNELFRGEYKVEDINYLDKENPRRLNGRKSFIYDIYCRTQDGKYVIVEMQVKKQASFFVRTVVYVAEALARQVMLGDEDYDKVKSVYGVYLMNFTDDSICNDLFNDFLLINKKTMEYAPNLINLLFLSLPLFNKEEKECETKLDKWIYLIKNMHKLETIPWTEEPVFAKLEKVARIANLTEEDYLEYRRELDAEKTMKDIIKTEIADSFAEGEAFGRKKGRAEGRAEERTEIAKNMLAKGMDVKTIMELTGLTKEDIQAFSN